MSLDDNSLSSPINESFGFIDQRSCRCTSNDNDVTTKSLEMDQRRLDGSSSSCCDDAFHAENTSTSSDVKQRLQESKNPSNDTNNEISMTGCQIIDTRMIAPQRFKITDETEHFNNDSMEKQPELDFHGSKLESKLHHQRDNLEQRLRGSARFQITGIHSVIGKNRESEDFTNFPADHELNEIVDDNQTIMRSDCERVSSSQGRINDEIPSTAGSSISFETSCSSTNEPNARIFGRSTDESLQETSNNRVQQIAAIHAGSVVSDFGGKRSNDLRSFRDKRRAIVNDVDANCTEIEEIQRLNVTTTNNIVTTVNYSPDFRNLHQDHMQSVQRGNNTNSKGNFDGIQVSGGNTMEKGKCQCHRIQQHQHKQPQILSHVQQRDQNHQHQHHHHHHQQQQQQQHRHKLTQQRTQTTQQPQQQQQQNYRHHHYHHPHQHISQQQEHQRTQNEQMSSRKQLSSSGQEDESDEMIETSLGSHQPPALPPRPPPRPNRRYEQNPIGDYDLGPNNPDDSGCCKKYVILCCLCGGLSAAVGSLFLAVHAVLSAHTASLALFETVPSYIPGSMLILMGLFTILLARRKHRYGFLMKMCGSVGVVCALVCVLVTVTTTVVHMSRLQGLRECIYTERARSCTCYGSTQGRILSDPGVLFEETPHCEAVHGALYDCLRALFGVSVAGILACIFSCMLLYQLLSHEKKKMYWEQLQLRCRSLYGQGGSGAVGVPSGGSCGCCNDCGGASPWWAQTPGNLYTPNPDLAPFSRRWRLPWSRSRGPAPTPDSNYGFHAQSRGAVVMRSSGSSSGEPGDNTPGPYSVLTDESQTGNGAPYSLINSTNAAPYAACPSSVGSYGLMDNGTGPALWGPPPPYSDPNSPARRGQLNDDRRSQIVTLRSTMTNSAIGTPVNASNNRISNVKRTIENFETGNCEEYRQQRVTGMRPSDNYENTEEIMSSGTDPDIEMGSLQQQQQQQHHHHHHHHAHQHLQRQQDDDGTKARRARKSLKGVENGGFQQETVNNSLIKQSESELYFGDVSSCCGPESSFYDLAVDKEQQQSGPVDPVDNSLMEYPIGNRPSKQRQSSKRSRLPLPLPSSHNPDPSTVSLTESYPPLSNPTAMDDITRNSTTRAGPYLAPDAQYEVIAQQTRYTYYNTANGDHDIPLSSLASLAYRNGVSSTEEINNDENDDDDDDVTSIVDYPNERLSPIDCTNLETETITNNPTSPTPSIRIMMMTSPASSPMSSQVTTVSQRCNNESRDSIWQQQQQIDHQTRSNEGVCPVNV